MVLLFAGFSENVLDDIPMVDDPAVVVLEDIDERLPPPVPGAKTACMCRMT